MLLHRLLCALVVCASFVANADIQYEIHYGPIASLHRKQLLPLRLTLFSDYPYLYCGNPDREETIWDRLSRESTILTLAYDHDELVGSIIALALDDTHHTIVQHREGEEYHGLMIDMVMVVESHQRKGIAREMLRQFQDAALAKGYTDVYGITVVRSENHPLKPQNFIDVDEVWSNMGGEKTGVTEAWNWPTQCGVPGNTCVAPIDNMIQYWHKKL